jgi:16S rRNA (uracil1498-N3)-methyltransferase
LPAFFARREGGRAVIEGDDARHLARSLRAKVGEEVEVIDPAGFMLTVRLDVVSPLRVAGVVTHERTHQPEAQARVTVAIANLPAAALELVLSRCTEAGAFSFCVYQADRSVARGAKPERWAVICREAAMLAGRLAIPTVLSAPSLEAAVRDAPTPPVMLAREAAEPLSAMAAPRHLTLLIGPEGGWTERELELVDRKATLGPRNLRTDTAALVGLAVALASRDATP